MPSREEITYFGAGPAPLPTNVLAAGAEALLNYENTGLGLAEISHRSPTANKILADAKDALTTLLDIPDGYEILFMQGGGSGEFSAVVQNLVGVWVEKRRSRAAAQYEAENGPVDRTAEAQIVQRIKKERDEELKLDFLVTGSWSLKASQEAARLIGPQYVNVAVDARQFNDGKFGVIPAEDQWKLTPTRKEGGSGPALVYFCDNETVDGVEFPTYPKSLEAQSNDEDDERLVVADMSSNFLSRKVDVRKYAVIFGGAQKNIGIPGITIVVVRKSLLPPTTASPPPALLHELGFSPPPIVFDYPTIAKNNSLYNTLPIFNLWIAEQVMTGLVKEYGVQLISGQEKVSDEKAKIIYQVLDKYPQVYTVVPHQSVRSRMNICFRVSGGDAEREKKFLAGAEQDNLLGLKGHRSVGGIRASNYNAVSVEGVQKLARYLEWFAQQ